MHGKPIFCLVLFVSFCMAVPDVKDKVEPHKDKEGGNAGLDEDNQEISKACTDPFDAIFRDGEGKTWVFRGLYAWQINNKGVEEGYPVLIKTIYKGLPGNINAAVTSQWSNRTYFFKGNRMWRYMGKKLERGFPTKVAGRTSGLKKNLDAAFQWGGDRQIYIFKGSFYYQFNEFSQRVAHGYPKKIRSHWKGSPKIKNIDAAFQWNDGKTYFFKGDEYWRFNDDTLKMDKEYPKSKAKFWMGCGGDVSFDD
ncbi:uncharacterized protein LOC144433639 [Glandiceps talaboti]